MNTFSCSRLDGNTTMLPCFVETMSAESKQQTWPAPTIQFAELLARKLSGAAIDNPSYPNLFFVVEFSGKARCHFLRGKRNAEALAA